MRYQQPVRSAIGPVSQSAFVMFLLFLIRLCYAFVNSISYADSNISLRGECRMKILIVDNNRTNSGIMAAILEKKDYSVMTAPNEKEAFGLIIHDTPDLILVDSKCREVKSFCQLIHKHTDIPLIIITDIKKRFEDFRYLETEADDFIIRPFVAEVLSFTIKSTFKRKAAQTASHNHKEVQLALMI